MDINVIHWWLFFLFLSFFWPVFSLQYKLWKSMWGCGVNPVKILILSWDAGGQGSPPNPPQTRREPGWVLLIEPCGPKHESGNTCGLLLLLALISLFYYTYQWIPLQPASCEIETGSDKITILGTNKVNHNTWRLFNFYCINRNAHIYTFTFCGSSILSLLLGQDFIYF